MLQLLLLGTSSPSRGRAACCSTQATILQLLRLEDIQPYTGLCSMCKDVQRMQSGRQT